MNFVKLGKICGNGRAESSLYLRVAANVIMIIVFLLTGSAISEASVSDFGVIAISDRWGRGVAPYEDPWLTVVNYTTKPLIGGIEKQAGSVDTGVTFTPERPLLSNSSVTVMGNRSFFYKEYTWGAFCYNNFWWNLPRQTYRSDLFTLYSTGIGGNDLSMDSQRGREQLIKTGQC